MPGQGHWVSQKVQRIPSKTGGFWMCPSRSLVGGRNQFSLAPGSLPSVLSSVWREGSFCEWSLQVRIDELFGGEGFKCRFYIPCEQMTPFTAGGSFQWWVGNQRGLGGKVASHCFFSFFFVIPYLFLRCGPSHKSEMVSTTRKPLPKVTNSVHALCSG